MAQSTTSKGPIHLRYHDDGQVVVTPEDQDRFVLASREAAMACQNQVAMSHFMEHFQKCVLAKLAGWCQSHSANVLACYIPFPFSGTCSKVFIVTNSAKFDFQLSDAIADLEVELDEARWPCDILQIGSGGPEQLQVFFDPEQSIQVFDNGDGGATPS